MTRYLDLEVINNIGRDFTKVLQSPKYEDISYAEMFGAITNFVAATICTCSLALNHNKKDEKYDPIVDDLLDRFLEEIKDDVEVNRKDIPEYALKGLKHGKKALH